MLSRSLQVFVSKVAGYGVRLVLPYVLVRLLTVQDFGAYRQFFLLEMYIGALFQLGLNQALYYFVPRDPRNGGAYFLNSLLLNLAVFTLAFAALAPFTGPLSHWLNMAVLKDAFGQLSGYVVLLMLTTACDCYLTASQRVRASAVFEITSQVLVSATCVATALATHRLAPILTALVVVRGVQLAAMLAWIHWRMRGFRAERWFCDVGTQVRYGLVLGAAGTLFSLLLRLHEFFVSRYYGPEGYALYSAGCTDLPVIQMFTQSLAVVALGQFASLEKQGDWDGIERLWRRILAGSYAVAIPTVAVLVLAAQPIVTFMFTEAYAGAVPIFRVNAVLKLAFVLNATLVLRAMNRNDVSTWIQAIALSAAPFLLYAGMRLGGMPGIIAVQALVMVGSRLLAVLAMNRLAPRSLAVLVGPGEVIAFYRETWQSLRSRRSGAGGHNMLGSDGP